MAIVDIIELCLSTILIYVILCAPVVEGRSLMGRHHHSRLDYHDPEQMSIPRNLPRLQDSLEYRDKRAAHRRHGYLASAPLGHSSEHVEKVSSPHRYGHEHDLTNYESSRRRKEVRRYDEESSNRLGARRKRHNKHGSTVNYRRITEQDKKDLLLSRQYDQELESGENGGLHESYELEVKEAQNSSICNYTVKSIPDIRGNRVPKDLEHVMCNHAGSSCQGAGSYCCIQTYKNVEVSYGDNGDRETMKLYVGCVCALQVFNGLQVVESPLRIHD
ncbi:hypothetical protein DMN91_012040 [Ooceraea biroi]|uniref:Uncharacterized protein n=1 Tax=Ooceraea biroi TaxID=2015173 RepID=A0A026WAY2_OOCBI|nr:uncharacterized protein LOC113563045 [Ooceraea biroi]EZA52836.1 hypothetical protein X777_07672 [Ooceraea biroi]RLU16280.1 hypothetical protein DMN91_012040 [Ooceraea biroi]